MLACVASYGDKDPRAINTLIANYKDAHDRFGMDVDVEVWVSDKKYATFRTEWPGIDVRVRVGDDSLGHDFAGLCRTSAKPHLHTDDYTHYLVSENDINVTSSNMEALCREHRHLDRTGRDDLHPMLVRYEDLVDTSGEFHRVVVDENYCNPPQVKKVEWHGGQRYVVPRNPYAAMFFLPVQRYRTYVDKLEKGIAMLRLEVRLFLVIFGYFWLFLVIFGQSSYGQLHRHELPGTDAFGERDAGMMDGSGQWLAQLEERAERQKRWQERITLRQTERDRANGRPAPGTPSDDMLPDAFAVHRAAKEAEWSEEIATLGLGRDRSRCLGPEHKVSLFCSLTVCPH